MSASAIPPTPDRYPPRLMISILAVSAVAATAIGCSSISTPISLDESKEIAANCPPDRRLAARAAIDVSGSLRAVAADAGRLDPVRALVRRTAICGGHLRIDGFSGSSAATAAIYDNELSLVGATENSRLRREPDLTDDVMAAIIKGLPIAAAKLPPDGTDIVAQLGLSDEFKRQLDPDGTHYVLDLLVVTDGIQTEQVPVTDETLTTTTAKELAEHVAAPELEGAEVHITSIGKTAGPPPPSSFVDALKAFHQRVCEMTRAARCTVVTDGAGR